MSDPATAEDRVSALAEDFLDRHRRGLKPSVESYAAAHPESADEIRRLFPALLMMEELKPASGDATGSFDAAAVVRGARLERLGDFRVLREVGRGGMGIVYEAEQESLGRRVALKVLAAPALQDTAQLRRFEREARAAARLHHTNIVPVFGVGAEQGLHYYVMQFIQGLGLDEVIAELKRLRLAVPKVGEAVPLVLPEGRDAIPTAAGLARSLITEQFAPAPQPPDDPSTTQAPSPEDPSEPAPAAPPHTAAPDPSSQVVLGPAGLSSVSSPGARYGRSVARVGLQVARALEYAHTQGLFHRDIKPSNLLLDVQGTAWVADFGLAKAVEGEDLTHTGDIVGTIRYMAPERFRGRCDARADVYALGLTLYEMLVLRPAFEQTDRQALTHQVMEEEPPRLRELNAAVPRDLETVVHKAIAKDPAGRYPTAAALAEDLERYLDGKPVRARAVGVLERCGKWAKRRPAVAALLASLVLAVLTGLVAVTWQWRAAVAARDEARRTLKMANDAVDTYFTQVSEEHLLEEPGMQPLREKLLKLSIPYYRKFAEQESNDPTLKVQLASAYLRWGTITGRILAGGSGDESKRLLRIAVSHFERLLGAQPTNLDIRIGLARSYQELAYQEAFGNAFRQGARTAHCAAQVWAGIVRDRPDDPEPVEMLGRCHDIAGVGLAMLGDLAGAKSEFREAVAVLKGAVERFPDDHEARRKLARALNNLGELLMTEGDLAGAVRIYNETYKLLQELLSQRPMSSRLRNDVAGTLCQLGKSRAFLGSLRPAAADLEQGRRDIDRVIRDNPKVIEYRHIQGETYLYIGLVRAERGQTGQARAILQEAIGLEQDLSGPNPTLTGNLESLAETSAYLAGVERETGRFDVAAKRCNEALPITKRILEEKATSNTDWIHLLIVIESARVAARTGESLSSREADLRTLLQEWESRAPVNPLMGANRRHMVEGYLALAEIAARSGSTDKVLQELDKAEASLTVALGATPDQPRLRSLRARIERARGFALAGAGKVDQAAAAASRAVDVAESLAREEPSYNYDLACARALQARLNPAAPGPPADAVKALRAVIQEGFDNAYKLEHDDRLAPLRSREDFQALVRLVKEKTATPAVRSEAANTGP